MKAITLWRPWAELVICGLKPVENRAWDLRHRGPLLIHAARKYDYDWVEKLPLSLAVLALNHFRATVPADITPTGLIGIVRVYDSTLKIKSRWHQDNCWGWYLDKVKRFDKPIDVSGQQGLWSVQTTKIIPALLKN